MFRLFVRYLTTNKQLNPKVVAPRKPKADTDFVSKMKQID